jgi:HK97 family phage prohead protease
MHVNFFFGYASIFNIKDLNGDIILPNSFPNEELLVPSKIPLLLEHNRKKQIGIITKLEQDFKGLFCEGEILPRFKFENIVNLSIGFIVLQSENIRNKTRLITGLKLFEISVVKFPANKHAHAFCI